MSRARPHLVGLVACGVGYIPHRDGATRRAVSTQLVVNPVCAHYRRHVTPGVCWRGGTLRRGSPRPEPSHGRIIRQPLARARSGSDYRAKDFFDASAGLARPPPTSSRTEPSTKLRRARAFAQSVDYEAVPRGCADSATLPVACDVSKEART